MFKLSQRALTISLFIISYQTLAQEIIQTPYELSGKIHSATYKEGMDFYNRLDEKFETVKVLKAGPTDQGIPLHLAVYNSDQEFDLTILKSSTKIKVLIMNAIHPGEPAGVDASMMLLKDIASGDVFKSIHNDFILAIIPFYNIGGALNRSSFSRANQNGPEEYGFRGNAKNLDLNRDFIKTDSENARSFSSLFHQLDPEIFIDTHTSNGADYPYTFTYLETHPEKLGGELGEFLTEIFSPGLVKSMDQKQHEIFPFVNVYNSTPDKGFVQFFDGPRYSTGYTALFQTIGYMSETHMLKSYSSRVESTREFLSSIIQEGVVHKDKIKSIRNDDRQNLKEQMDFVINWEADDHKKDTLTFKGYKPMYTESNVTGQQRLIYDHSNPITTKIPYYNSLVAEKSIRKPKAYLIPQEWKKVIDNLKVNGIDYSRLTKDTSLLVTYYQINDYKTYRNPYEGHYPHYDIIIESINEWIDFEAGDYLIETNQNGIRYMVETLEPEAPDSFFNWNYFDPILSQKEHFSSYVFEESAEKLLNDIPSLKDSLIYKRDNDDTFKNDSRAQLNYIYEHSPYFEKSYKRYPVFRIE